MAYAGKEVAFGLVGRFSLEGHFFCMGRGRFELPVGFKDAFFRLFPHNNFPCYISQEFHRVYFVVRVVNRLVPDAENGDNLVFSHDRHDQFAYDLGMTFWKAFFVCSA